MSETLLADAMSVDRAVVANVEACITANHANMLPMVEILKVADKLGVQPYRDLEDAVCGLPIMAMSHNNEHVLAQLLVDCGALEKTLVPEELPAEDVEVVDGDAAIGQQLEDQPVDYLLSITPEGRAAIATFEPTKRLAQMVATEPENYAEVYAGILRLCEDGAKLPAIEAAFGTHPAMKTPKRVYTGHFVSNLETAGGIVWQDDAWRATQAGLAFAKGVAAAAATAPAAL